MDKHPPNLNEDIIANEPDKKISGLIWIRTHGLFIKPRANGRNIVGQQPQAWLDVTCCVRLHTLLHVVGYCCV